MMNVYAYDRASWHDGPEFPADLPASQAFVHMGLFLAWIIEQGFHDTAFFAEVGLETLVTAVRSREITGTQLLEPLAGVLASDELSGEGNAFTRAYYEVCYGTDYRRVLASGLPSFYHVRDSWENYDRLKPTLDGRYQAWLAAGRPTEVRC